uniref:Uncharacterized protein n=1 Tax=Anguilla anguilla TaxID=7936 RepID=A0A0E9VTH1_ANGAN
MYTGVYKKRTSTSITGLV